LVLSFPPRNPAARVIVGAQNLVFMVMGREFRTFAHPPAAMLAVLEERGFRSAFAHRGLVWRVAGLER
jgi:magnesium-protoporphyrin O-methyltransferase